MVSSHGTVWWMEPWSHKELGLAGVMDASSMQRKKGGRRCSSLPRCKHSQEKSVVCTMNTLQNTAWHMQLWTCRWRSWHACTIVTQARSRWPLPCRWQAVCTLRWQGTRQAIVTHRRSTFPTMVHADRWCSTRTSPSSIGYSGSRSNQLLVPSHSWMQYRTVKGLGKKSLNFQSCSL